MRQKDLAEKAQVSVSFLSEIENNHRTPGSEVLLRIADALGASLDYLVRGKDTRPEPEPLTFPPPLQEAAEQEQWSYGVTASLLRAHSSVRYKRTPDGQGRKPPREWEKEDWIRLHALLYEE